MKKFICYTLFLTAAFLLSGCLKDMKDTDSLGGSKKVEIGITLPDFFASESKAGFKVTLRNQKTGVAYVLQTDEAGKASVEAEYGKYSITVGKQTEMNGVVKYLSASSDIVLNKDNNNTATANLKLLASNKGTIILKEVYFQYSLIPVTNKNYTYSQYFTLYNNSDKVQYLDGIGFGVHTQFNSMTTVKFNKYWLDAASVEPRDSIPANAVGMIFPGTGTQHPLQPGEEVIIALSAINHTSTATTTPVDLSGSNVWAMYVPNKTTAQLTPASTTNLMSNFYYGLTAKTITVGAISPAFFIYRIESNVSTYTTGYPVSGQKWGNVMYQPTTYTSMPSVMVPKEWVYDGVEFSTSTAHPARLCPEISLQSLVIPSAVNGGHSYVRKVDAEATAKAGHTIYQDTNNSADDWVLSEHPLLYKGN